MYKNEHLLKVLQQLSFGSSIAEEDQLLEAARVETSVFTDLLTDRVDLIPGTKGSGKSSLYRIFVEFLPGILFAQRKVVIAHGVTKHGDPVFHVYKERFERLSEDDFVNFWCIYLISLVHEQFIKDSVYSRHLDHVAKDVGDFVAACQRAHIPDIKGKKTLKQILDWTLNALAHMKPTIRYKLPENGGEVEVDLWGNRGLTEYVDNDKSKDELPAYVSTINEKLQILLKESNLTLWLMIDKLDEIFPRRSPTERRALRGLLRTMRLFSSDRLRVKIFLRDDILSEVTQGREGFTALTHITARQSDTLRWNETEILTLIVKRLVASDGIVSFLDIDRDQVAANLDYRSRVFYMVFPRKVHAGDNQSTTIRWLFSRTADANGVVTPRDIIDLLTKAKQQQQTLLSSNTGAESDVLIGSQSLQYGLAELSQRKAETYLHAEFPHLWGLIEKFRDGHSEYTQRSLTRLLGRSWEQTASDLISIGFMSKLGTTRGEPRYRIPHIYRKCLGITRGRVE